MNGEYNLNKMDVDVLRRNLGWFMAFGVGLIILGAISVAAPFLATFAIVNLVGILFLIAGVMSIIHAFRSRTWGRSIAEFLISLLYILFAIILLAYPGRGIVTLTMFLAAFFVVEGIIKIVQAFRLRPVSNWGWALFSG